MPNITLVLDDGEEVFKSLKTLAKEKNIQYGTITGVKGAIKDFEIVTHGQRGTVERMAHKKEFEVNAMSGKLEYRDKETRLKLNVLISSSGFTPMSGELLNGKAAGRLEISVKKTDLGKMIEA